jgi:DNA invertase Pin-like site-specific DNA recombinase
MKTIAYVRVSTDAQDVTHQRLAILEFARTERLVVDAFLESQASARHSLKARHLEVLFDSLERGDTLIVSELSRLGRSVGEIMTTVDRLVHHQMRVFALKQDLQSRVIVTLFGLFAEIERGLLSLRTKEALATARAAGKRLGRPPGALGKSRLDGKEQEIQTLLGLRVSQASIAKMTGVDRSTLAHFIQSRRLMQK